MTRLLLSKIVFLIFTGIILLSSTSVLLAYKTIKSAHFHVHYPKELKKETALDVLEWAEGAYLVLRKIYPYDINTVHIHIHNKVDQANGSAMVYLFSKINVYLFDAPHDSLIGFKNWMQSLLIHELTHIFTMDASRGYAKALKYIFGYPPLPFTTPNLTLPNWIHEGVTILNESLYANGGRLNTTYFDMYYRKNVLFNDFPHISKSNTYWSNDEYPFSRSPYVYGGGIFYAIFQHLQNKNPTGILSDIHSGRFYWWVNYGIETLLENEGYELSEMSYEDFYKIFQNIETARQVKNLEIIRQGPVSRPEILLESNDPLRAMTYDPANDVAYLVRSNISEKNGIYSYDMRSKKMELLIKEYSIGDRLALDKQGHLYFHYYKKYNNRLYTVPCRYDLDRDKKEVLDIKGIRFFDISPAQDSSKVVGLSSDLQSRKHLEVLYLKENKVVRLLEDTKAIHPFFIDNENIVIMLYNYDNNRTQFININLNTKNKTTIIEVKGRATQPCFSNEKIYFTSDSNGVYNLYYFDIKNKKVVPLSNLETGGFFPAPAGDKLLFLLYWEKGFSLSTVPLGNESEYETVPVINTQRVENVEFRKHKLNNINEEGYLGFSYLKPYGWMPYYQSGSGRHYLGAFTTWRDPLDFHSISLYTVYDFANKDYLYNADYAFMTEEGFALNFTSGKSIITYNQPEILPDDIDRFYQTDFSNSLYFGYVVDTFSFTLTALIGGVYNYWSSLTGQEDIDFYEGNIYGPSANLSFTNRDFYLKSIRPVDGIYINLLYNYFIKHRLNEIGLDIFYSYGGIILSNDVFSLKSFTRAAVGDRFKQSYYSIEEKSILDDDLRPCIRGYDDGYIYGYYYTAGNVEYSFPLLYLFRGWGTKPIFLRGVYLTGFFDFAQASNKDFSYFKRNDFIISYGCELGISSLLFYHLPVDFIVTYARAHETNENKIYIAIKIPLGETMPLFSERVQRRFFIPDRNSI